jgi:hypothetical protein
VSHRCRCSISGMTSTIRFDTKIAVVLREDLATWQKLNVTAFLVSGIAGTQSEVMGKPYEDADGTLYLPMFRQPVLVFAANEAAIKAVHEKALSRELDMSIFTEQLFATGNDDDNREAVIGVKQADLRLVGVAVYGPKNAVDRTVKGCTLHG